MKNKKQNFIDNKIEILANAESPDSFWKALKFFRVKKTQNNPIPLSIWEDFFRDEFRARVPTQLHLKNLHIQELDKDITLEEVNFSLIKCKTNKSPGRDGVSYEFFKNLPDNWKLYICVLFNKIWNEANFPDPWANILVKMIFKKGDIMNPNYYRPISLVNSVVKIYTEIINYRLNRWCELNDVLPEFQTGFRKNRGCMDKYFYITSGFAA